jgi:hypothetical protein
LAQPSQNKLALLAARHFGAEQLKDEWVGRLAKSPDRGLGRLGFQATQASTIHKRLRIVAHGGAQPSSAIRSLAKLKTMEKADEKEAQRGASSLICSSSKIGTPDGLRVVGIIHGSLLWMPR